MPFRQEGVVVGGVGGLFCGSCIEWRLAAVLNVERLGSVGSVKIGLFVIVGLVYASH